MKKKILLVWWYDRQDLIAPYLEMKDELDITVLFYRFPHQETKEVAESLPFRRIYWLDYLSPYHLLKDIQPEKVLFFGIESVLTISLIAAAKIKNIPTAYISHGLRGDLNEVIKLDSQPISIERYQKSNKNYNEKKWHTLVFLFLVFSLKKLSSVKLIFEVLRSEFKYKNTFERLQSIKSKWRKVDQYYLYAPENAILMQELDHPDSKNIFYTGPFIIDSLFKEFKEAAQVNSKDYWLLIDQPIYTFTTEQKIEFYQKLVNVAQANNKNLVVKLHPMDYEKDLNISNIQWIKTNNNMTQLIMESCGILGFFSTMLLPIICYKKCILFETNSTSLVKKWEDIQVVKRVNLESFQEKDINFDGLIIDEKSRNKFIQQFVVHMDGQCTQRLKSLILQ